MCPTDVSNKFDSPITLVFLPRFKCGTSPEEEQAGQDPYFFIIFLEDEYL